MASKLYLLLVITVGYQCVCAWISQTPNHQFISERDVFGRVISGRLAASNQFSYAAFLIVNNEHMCTASVIGPRTILTAAHCLINTETRRRYPPNSIIAHVGHVDDRKTQKYVIAESIPHPSFSDNVVQFNDIGIVKTAQDITSMYVGTACIASSGTPIDQYFENTVAFGWGYTDEVKGKLSVTNYLRFVNLGVVTYSACKQRYPQSTIGHLCALSATGNICFGDSGGPLSSIRPGKKDVIIGVSSIASNKKCTVDANRPPLFTRVSSYEQWIIQAAGYDGRNICRG